MLESGRRIERQLAVLGTLGTMRYPETKRPSAVSVPAHSTSSSSAHSTFNAVELNRIPEGHGIIHPQNRLLKCVQTLGAGTLLTRVRPQLHQRLPRRLPDGDEVIHMAAVLVIEQTIDRWDRLI